MKKVLALCFLFFFLLLNVFAQNENNIWYFGKNAGLDFNSGSPVPLLNSAMNTWEGSASVADPVTGSLLFYTNGESVWNSNHTLMPNGTGLWGQFSSTQSSLIVPKPGSTTEYYLFTTDGGTGGFPNGGAMAYSMIDMTLNGGLGDVFQKNNFLFDTTTEKLTATLSEDRCKVWVLAHKWNSNEFYAYQVSDSGINPPVISAAGSTHSCAYYGQMKVSPDGSKLALPLPCDSAGNSMVELFDFDNVTGVVSGGILLPQDHFVYGIEFSPSSQYLYAVDHNNSGLIIYKQVAQYDVTAGSAAAINASRIIVGAVWNATTFFNGAAQLAPDGKIYIVPTDNDSLCVINAPDSAGLACNFVVPGFYLVRQNDHGLPNRVVTAEFPCAPPTALFNAPNHICPGTCTQFNNLSLGADTYQWLFSGANPATSTDMNPSNICYQTPGVYDVSLVATNSTSGFSDTLTLSNFMTVYNWPASQGIMQNGDTLTANQGAVSYQWFYDGAVIPGATDYYYVAQASGNYNVVATDANGCEVEAGIFDVIAAIDPFGTGNQYTEVFPIPASVALYIRTKIVMESISVFNALGKKISVQSMKLQEGFLSVDIKDLSEGIYFLHLEQKENTFTPFKFIVHR